MPATAQRQKRPRRQQRPGTPGSGADSAQARRAAVSGLDSRYSTARELAGTKLLDNRIQRHTRPHGLAAGGYIRTVVAAEFQRLALHPVEFADNLLLLAAQLLRHCRKAFTQAGVLLLLGQLL